MALSPKSKLDFFNICIYSLFPILHATRSSAYSYQLSWHSSLFECLLKRCDSPNQFPLLPRSCNETHSNWLSILSTSFAVITNRNRDNGPTNDSCDRRRYSCWNNDDIEPKVVEYGGEPIGTGDVSTESESSEV